MKYRLCAPSIIIFNNYNDTASLGDVKDRITTRFDARPVTLNVRVKVERKRKSQGPLLQWV